MSERLDLDQYFVKMVEYCRYDLDCVKHLFNDTKRLKSVLGISTKRELDKILTPMSYSFNDLVLRNLKIFPADHQAKVLAETCGDDFVCVFKTIKENGLIRRLPSILVELGKYFDIEPEISQLIEDYKDAHLETADDLVELRLPEMAWLALDKDEFPEIGLFLELGTDTTVLTDIAIYVNEYLRSKIIDAYREVFENEPPPSFIDNLEQFLDIVWIRMVERIKEIAKRIYDYFLTYVKEHPETYEIVGYVGCEPFHPDICIVLGLDKIPVILDKELLKEQEEAERRGQLEQ